MTKTTTTTTSAALIVAVFIFASACGPNQRILQSANENTGGGADASSSPNSNSASAGTSFEQDLEAMRTADFKFILIFRRKDGHPLDADDKRYLGQVIPAEINRRRLSDSGRAVIIGSNFRLSPELTTTLTTRFSVDDHSAPGADGAR
jgi:hypothetical protein